MIIPSHRNSLIVSLLIPFAPSTLSLVSKAVAPVLAMAENMKPEKTEGVKKIVREIKIKSPDLPALLVDFLSEVLYLTQVNKEIYNKVKFKKFSDPSINSGQVELEAELLGQKVKRFGEDIKAVTYHSLNVYQNKDGSWEAIVLFDI